MHPRIPESAVARHALRGYRDELADQERESARANEPARRSAADVAASAELSTEELNALVEDATIDAYDYAEQLAGSAVMIENNLRVPFQTTILGMAVTVQNVTQTAYGISADCVRDGHRQAISVLDLPLPEPPPKGAQRIAAYRHWAAAQ